MKKHDTEFWDSKQLNNRTYRYYLERLTELSISMVKWTNLPPTIDERFLELTLYSQGSAVFFYEPDIGFLALRGVLSGERNVYDIPIERTAYASNGFYRELDDTNSVIIYNNYLHTPSADVSELYARKLYEIDRTVDVNVIAQKTPKILLCEENQRLTLKNLFMKYEGNVPFIYGNKALDIQALNVLDTSSPYVSDSLQILKRQIFNEFLTLRGIENTNTEKKERQITDEVSSNLGAVEASRWTFLTARKQACRQINEMFGLNIDCEYRSQLGSITMQTPEAWEEGEPE